MTVCKKDTDPVDAGQLKLSQQLNNPLTRGMTACRTTRLIRERTGGRKWEGQGEEGRQLKWTGQKIERESIQYFCKQCVVHSKWGGGWEVKKVGKGEGMPRKVKEIISFSSKLKCKPGRTKTDKKHVTNASQESEFVLSCLGEAVSALQHLHGNMKTEPANTDTRSDPCFCSYKHVCVRVITK